MNVAPFCEATAIHAVTARYAGQLSQLRKLRERQGDLAMLRMLGARSGQYSAQLLVGAGGELRGLAAEGRPYRGFLYVGLMITADGPKVVEFNARMDDPETQVVLPGLAEDLLPHLWNAADGRIEPGTFERSVCESALFAKLCPACSVNTPTAVQARSAR